MSREDSPGLEFAPGHLHYPRECLEDLITYLGGKNENKISCDSRNSSDCSVAAASKSVTAVNSTREILWLLLHAHRLRLESGSFLHEYNLHRRPIRPIVNRHTRAPKKLRASRDYRFGEGTVVPRQSE